MKPSRSILDKRFEYVPASHTSVAETWRKHGWKPQEELRRRSKTMAKSRRGAVPPAAIGAAAVSELI
jgi:hypothetical protein